ncbi:MAG: CPBP family intramembrane glutamic endopeptidase, partial [Bacillales bacterium]
MQLSSLIGLPLTIYGFKSWGINQSLAVPSWLLASFTIALLIIMFILRKELNNGAYRKNGGSLGQSVIWAVSGIFLALFAQYAAAIIENMLGIEMGSENTKDILTIIEAFPLAIIVTSIIGPILEEIVFRKIIFGALHNRFNFFISALISSVIFAAAHMEFQHILLYSAMGFT